MNGALALLLFLKTVLELDNVSLQLLETGLCIHLCLRWEGEGRGERGGERGEGRGERGGEGREGREEEGGGRKGGGRKEGGRKRCVNTGSFMKLLNDTSVTDVRWCNNSSH